MMLQSAGSRETADKKERHFSASWKLPGKKLLTFLECLTPKSQSLKDAGGFKLLRFTCENDK